MVPEAARPLLDLIASGEATRYDELYGGGLFHDYSQHPNIPIPIREGPNAGKVSTAAGRYQFLGSTWNHEAAKLGLADFSPDSQDEAAWDLAKTTYQERTGRDLLDDVKSGMTALIRPALAGQWPSLGGGGRGGLASAGSTAGFGAMPKVPRETLPKIAKVDKEKALGALPKEPEIPSFKPTEVAEAVEPRVRNVRVPRERQPRGVRPAPSNLARSFQAALAQIRRGGRIG